MRSDISALYPSIYNGILETDILAEIGDIQYNQLFDEITAARRNLFVMTADARGVEAFERVYNIRADMQTETLEFRRQRLLNRMNTVPPFTIRFLRERLDSISMALSVNGRRLSLLGGCVLCPPICFERGAAH